MNRSFHLHLRNRAQTLVFFTLAFGTIFLLLGLAIDSGLLYLAKARLSRAVDGAALAAVGNFSLGKDQVAITMRNFAVANYADLGIGHNVNSLLQDYPISSSATGVQSYYTLPNGQQGSIYTYSFNDGVQDANGAYRKYVQVILKLGAGNQVTSATCNARCPVRTYFMWFAGSFFKDLKVSSSAVATRNPRLIMVVVDRSGSMLEAGGGAYTLPNAIISFLNFFDTSSDYIGIVSFSSNARLEMPMTTNFLYAGTNVLYDAYQLNTNYGITNGVPGVDPEEYSSSVTPPYEPGYATNGIRRMKFGGSTSADEGIRLGLETMMANSSFNDPDVDKYMVIFTDGAWNNVRTLFAAPGYTNVVTYPASNTFCIVTNSPSYTVPSLSPYMNVTNALSLTNAYYAAQLGASGSWDYTNHTSDVWQSQDSSGYEPLPVGTVSPIEGRPMTVTNDLIAGNNGPLLGTNSSTYGTNVAVYTTSVNVWLQPGSVDYVYNNVGAIQNTYVSNLNNPTTTVTVTIPVGGSNVLVVPGYLIDGTFTDSLDLPYPDDTYVGDSDVEYRFDNYLLPNMWPDDGISTNSVDILMEPTNPSQMRQLMFRNYVNLLTGYYIYRADDPLQVQTSTTGFEPLAKTDAYPNGYPRPLNGLGAYYPSAGFYWPFDYVGTDDSPNNPEVDPTAVAANSTLDVYSRNISWSINMLSTNAAPNWAGELFYGATGGTNVVTGASNTSVSTQISALATWENGASSVASGTPAVAGWLGTFINNGLADGILTNDPSHYGTGSSNIINGTVLRPNTFIGNLISTSGNTSGVTPGGSITGGYVQDNNGNVYKDSMAYSGRPTHYYDFSQSKWVPIGDNHNGTITTGLGYWKAQEYAWHARAMGVTIYTVGYGHSVHNDECVTLAEMANATNVSLADGTSSNFLSSSYNIKQPIGEQFYATTNSEIIDDFKTIGTAINSALTQ